MKSIQAFSQATIFHIARLFSIYLCCTAAIAGWQAPLSEQDIATLSLQVKTQTLSGNRTRNSVKSDDSLGLEVLLVELQEKKSRASDDARIAEVFVYNYASNSAAVQLINVDTRERLGIRQINNIHLPLNNREINLANQLLLNDADFIRELEHEYLARFGQPLKSVSELDMKVSIWDPNQNHENSVCKQTRCALVSVFTHGHYNFSIEPVVEFQKAAVHLGWVQ